MVKKIIIFIIILLLLNFILKQDYIYYLRDYIYDTNNNVIVFKEENNALKKEIKELKNLLELKNTNYKGLNTLFKKMDIKIEILFIKYLY